MSEQLLSNGVGTSNPIQTNILPVQGVIPDQHEAQATNASQIPPTLFTTLTASRQRKWHHRLKNWSNAYFGALASVVVLIHLVASIVTVALYFAPLPLPLPLSGTPWYAPFNGALFSYIIIWPLSAICFRQLATAKGSNLRSFGLLQTRYCQLAARLGINENADFPQNEPTRVAKAKMSNPQPYQLVALQEAYHCLEGVRELLQEHGTGLKWAMGLGYITAWGLVHRAEEALIEIEPVHLVIRGAMHDKWAIQHSEIGNREELLETIIQAATDVSESASIYFKEHQPGTTNQDIRKLQQDLTGTQHMVTQLIQALKQLNPSIVVVNEDSNTSADNAKTQSLQVDIEARGRSALHEVRRTLNQYRDNLWEGLVRARNQLWSAAALTSLITHILLSIAILAVNNIANDTTANTRLTNILAATTFYITGAIAGLFARLYRESLINSGLDDYGLSTMRLVTTPLISGLAGVGGVIITALLYGAILTGHASSSPDNASLSTIFQFGNPLSLIVAAIFGLTPNLIIKSLQEQTEKYASQLQSSSTVRGSSSTDITKE